jgi:hypothetical protein
VDENQMWQLHHKTGRKKKEKEKRPGVKIKAGT